MCPSLSTEGSPTLTSAVSADPEALRRYRRFCSEPDQDLLSESRRLATALAAARAAGLPVPGEVDGAVNAFARTAASIDQWVGEVGDAFAAADSGALSSEGVQAVQQIGLLRPPAANVMLLLLGAGSPVDGWIERALPSFAARRRRGDAEVDRLRSLLRDNAVAAYAGRRSQLDRQSAERALERAERSQRATVAEIQQFLRYLDDDAVVALAAAIAPTARQLGRAGDRREAADFRRRLSPLRARLAAQCSSSSDRLLRDLKVPEPHRRTANPVLGFLNGLVAGDFDDRGYDNRAGEIGRASGHLLSGFLGVGDVRDAIAHGHRRQIGPLALDGLALVPLAGDMSKAVRKSSSVIDSLRDVDTRIGAINGRRKALDRAAARIEVLSDTIARGHAWAEHHQQFPDALDEGGLAAIARRVVKTGEYKDNMRHNREAWWEEATGTLVIRDPRHADLGTIFRPDDGRFYWEGNVK